MERYHELILTSERNKWTASVFSNLFMSYDLLSYVFRRTVFCMLRVILHCPAAALSQYYNYGSGGVVGGQAGLRLIKR